MRLSASQVVARDNCARYHWYQSIAKIRARSIAANLVFGSCVDAALRCFLQAVALNAAPPDPTAVFLQHWKTQRQSKVITYAATQTPEAFEKMGVDLMRQLPTAWDATGYQVALDRDGKPLIDVRLRMHVGSMFGIELEYDGVIDLMVYDVAGALGVLDIKSAQAAHTPLYTFRSDQLTGYQMLMEANGEALGLPSLGMLGFWDLLKRKDSSKFEEPLFVPKRAPVELAEFRQKLFWIADDIRRQRFPKVSRMQFNSPCQMCEYSQHCVYGDEEGLIFPSKTERASA